jgi:hypothetical protein
MGEMMLLAQDNNTKTAPPETMFPTPKQNLMIKMIPNHPIPSTWERLLHETT